MKPLDLVDKHFGRLTAIKRVGKQNGHITWLCECECGNTTVVQGSSLKNGHVKSCGCLWDEAISKWNHSEKKKATTAAIKTTHGQNGTRLYRIWQGIKRRCGYKKGKDYKYYGGRGIQVCDEWKNSFESFYDWSMKNGYEEHLTIDRIDVNGNYEPLNCRWITMKEQSKNKRKRKGEKTWN